MATVAQPHCPLPSGSSFLELDYREETNHIEDYQTSLVLDPNLMPKLMMHHHDDLLMLMVASHGCIGW
jgi:hypothetical protein